MNKGVKKQGGKPPCYMEFKTIAQMVLSSVVLIMAMEFRFGNNKPTDNRHYC